MELPTQDEILKLISIIQRKTQMYLNKQTSELGLTSGQAPFIMITCENGRIPQNRFAELLDMNKSTVTKMVAKLEENGYMTREANACDSRSFDVYPTEKAYEVLPELQRIGTGWVDEITADMTEIEKAVFFDLLRKSAERAGKYFDNH